jgi:SAM-dependent methyltransferase
MSVHDDQRKPARTLARDYIARGDALGWFEALYAGAAGDTSVVPWADLAPNPHLLTWLNNRTPKPAGRALVVGCGLGDDAEELAKRGLHVTAFDVAPSAIAWCIKRFPGSNVEYAVADLLDPPHDWRGAFDFVFEAYTLQAMPLHLRPRAIASLARFLRDTGQLLVICRGRLNDEPLADVPWPLTRDELAQSARAAALREHTFEEFFDDEDPPVRRFCALYRL